MQTIAYDTLSGMQDYLAKELQLNGVNLHKQAWLQSPVVLAEIAHTLVPEIHEGKVSSYGVLFAENKSDFDDIEIIPMKSAQLALARSLADGEQWFLFFEKDHFEGLISFKNLISNEIQLIRNFPISGGLLMQRTATGITKFFQGDSLAIHDNRRWFTKPNVKTAAWKVSQCVGGVDKFTLNRILEFAFHFMSPTDRVGAILVWMLKDPDVVLNGHTHAGEDLESLKLSLLNDSHTRMICHLLSHVDGATFLDERGNVIRTGVQLKYSDKSRELIPEFKGTRHTSAVRCSYDLEDSIVVAISEDGPVTVFSSGANIADLQIYSAHKKARLLRDELPEQSEDIQSDSFTMICDTCQKQSMIEQVVIKGLNRKQSLLCPICKATLYTSVCFSLEGRPYKKIK